MNAAPLLPETIARAFAHKYGGEIMGPVVFYADQTIRGLRQMLVEHGYTRVKDEAGVHFERDVQGHRLVLFVDRATYGIPAIEFQLWS